MTLNRMLVPMSLGTLSNDLRQVRRQIRKGPDFAGAVILVLAAGFGISTAVSVRVQRRNVHHQRQNCSGVAVIQSRYTADRKSVV